MDAIENLLSWAQTQGITVSNVGPRALPGRGIGIVVTSPLKREKFESHWSLVSSTPLPDLPQDEQHQYQYPEGSDDKLTYESYLHAWLLVNSRTFYHVTPKTAKRHRDDHMILQPVADLLNHASRGCSVAFDKHSFTIKANRAYDAGEEIHICYGRHSNDFLLVEYGFIMAQGENEWDEVCIDDVLLPRLSAAHRRRLEERGFLGNYVIDAETVCYRTQVALRTLVLPARRWAQFVDGFADGEAEQPEVDVLLREMLSAYDVDIESKIKTVRGLDEGEQFQRDMVVARWKQIQLLVRSTIEKLNVSNT
ncbi:uncharacterized protein N0V96_005615 [Colletotrichum fioriniae]|uniref:uncharacterized protein n=1 Tax=Colletotrichum fioriniae TaxID=710243 RepID=UPI0032DA1A3F|nr:hypothetical protein N0V96_005615 [Colletotrichum fioriniae]